MKRALTVIGAVMLAAGLALAGTLWYVTPQVRSLLVENLSRQTGRPVRLEALSWAVFTGISLSGRGIEIGPRPGTTEPPLLLAESIRVSASLSGLLGGQRRIDSVRLRGLKIHIPSRRGTDASEATASPSHSGSESITLGRLILEDAVLEIASSDPARTPRVFEIHELRMESLRIDRELPFKARLTYPRPEGELEVQGSFGPWDPSDPLQSALSGTYDFREADLGTFRRIRGKLTAKGTFEGTVEHSVIRGEAYIPDFALTRAGQTVPLRTVFSAELKERGELLELEEVETRFFDSILVSRGNIIKEGDGRRVELRVIGEKSRIEDLLKFALKSEEPPLVGDARIETDVLIPSDRAKTVLEKIRIQGNFKVQNGRFTNVNLQKTFSQLSRIAGGESGGEEGESAVSHMSGEFTLEDAVVDFQKLVFGVPDFDLDLAGQYFIIDESMNLEGRLLLTRAPSEMLPESWSRWTRIIDPLFRSDQAGTTLPIVITGTRTRPSIRIKGR